MKTTIAMLLTVVAITCTSSSASAAKLTASSSSNTSATQMNFADLLYDYAVYAGEPRYRWVIIWEYGDGSTSEQGQFLSEQDALNFAAWLYFGGYEPEGVVDFTLVEKEVAPIMEYVATFDKKEDAIALANVLQNLGLYTDIQKIGLFTHSMR